MKKQIVLVGVASGMWLLAQAASAATVLVVQTESFRGSAGGTATVYVDDGRVRIDSDEGGSNFTIIYGTDDGRPTYWIIDRKEKSYYKIDRRTMLKTRSDLEQSIETMRRQLKDMPAAQREQMERTMRQNMERMGFVDSHVTYSSVARGIKIGEWVCHHYQGQREGVKVEEVWAADAGEMGIRDGDLEVLGELAELFESTGQDMPAFFSFDRKGRDDASTYEGFPVIVVTYDDGERREKSQVMEVRREKLATDFFEIPKDLTEKSFAR